MNLLDVLGKLTVKINLSGMFSTPPAAPVVTPTPETSAIAQMNDDLQSTLHDHSSPGS